MESWSTEIPGLVVLCPKRFNDSRGFFEETWTKKCSQLLGMKINFVQDNLSFSKARGTIRGLHFQVPGFAQAKLVRCARGALFDVAVDLRVGSPKYGEVHTELLTRENGRQLFIPEGFAHGFMSMEDNTEIQYKCSAFFAPEFERSISYDDPTLGVPWPNLGCKLTVSPKDAAAPPFSALLSPFVYK